MKIVSQPARNTIGEQEADIFLLCDPVQKSGNGTCVTSSKCSFPVIQSPTVNTIHFLLYVIGALLVAVLVRKASHGWSCPALNINRCQGMARMVAQDSRRSCRSYEYDESSSSAATTRRTTWRAHASRGLHAYSPRCTRSASEERADERGGGGIISRHAVHRRVIACRSSTAARCASILKAGSFLESSSGVLVTDLDGNRFYDLAGSYGVNVFGYDFYKECIEEGSELVKDLGPVLGSVSPGARVQRAPAEAKSRGSTKCRSTCPAPKPSCRRCDSPAITRSATHVVRFCGAYHGWWGDVQPGVGNPITARETYTLNDMSAAALRVLRHRKDIACVLVNPLQALHPNANAPGDSALLDSSRNGALRQSGVHGMAQTAARGLHRPRHRSDLRRSVRRLPPRHWAVRRNTSACKQTW